MKRTSARTRLITACTAAGSLVVLCHGQLDARVSPLAFVPAVEPPSAQTAEPKTRQPQDLSVLLTPILEKHKLHGLAAALVSTEGLQSIGAAGLRAAGHDESITPQDQFHLGSCTKAMTATLIAILVEEGKLSWETTLPEALPQLKDSIHEKYKDITIADLLTQRSGVPADMQREGLLMRLWSSEAPLIEQREDCTKTVLSWGPDHDAKTFVYSNTNFIIAGHIAEVATGKSWEDLIREKLFEPLGMTSAGFGAPGNEGKIDQPQGHTPDGKAAGVGKQADNPAALGPAGTVHASLEDWGKFISLHLRGAVAAKKNEGVTIGNVTIRSETFRKLQEPVRGGGAEYAMGWGVAERPWAKGPDGASKVLTHSGSNTMWFCVVWAAPDAGFAMLAATNSMSPDAQQACDEAIGVALKSRSDASTR